VKADLNLDVVKDLALDVWEDLGRTRLAGVAVGLTIALLGATGFALLPNGEAEVATGSPTIMAAVPEGEVNFMVPGEQPIAMDDVKLSAPRDPFSSLDRLAAADDQTLLAAGSEIVDSVMGSDSSGGIPVPDSTSSLMPLDDLDGTPTPTPTTPTEPQADFDDADDHEPADAPVTDYSYAADVQFGLVDDLRRYSSVQRLGLLPSRRLPLLMYLGVTSDHETAVFMVDSRLSQGGEGQCVPKDSLCTFLELRPNAAQDEHHFRDADGNEYLLRLRALTRTTASDGTLQGRDVSELRGSPQVVDGER
jgi:hypothetical protein